MRLTLENPSQKQLNRLMREFSSDRFLILEFKKSHSKDREHQRLVKAFFQHVLDHGVYVCGRHYEFALLSASQTRENKVTFFNGDTEKVCFLLTVTNALSCASTWATSQALLTRQNLLRAGVKFGLPLVSSKQRPS